MADKAVISHSTDFDKIPSVDLKALVLAQPKPLAVVLLKPLAIVPPKHIAKVSQRYEQAYYVQEPSNPSPTRRLLQGIANGKQVAIPKGTLLLQPKENERLMSVQTNKNGKLICAKYTTAHPVIQGVRASPNEVCYIEHLTPTPKPKRKRATSALALEKTPKQPAPTLRTVNEKLEGLSDIVRGMEKSNNLSDKLIEGMDKQLGISFKFFRSLRSDKDKLEAEIVALQEEIQGLNRKG